MKPFRVNLQDRYRATPPSLGTVGYGKLTKIFSNVNELLQHIVEQKPVPHPQVLQYAFSAVSKAALSIKTRDPREAFQNVRSLLLDWLRLKIGHELPSDMQAGETAKLDQEGATRTQTVLLPDPLFWALCRHDPDRNYPQRKWITEASVSVTQHTLVVGYRLLLFNRGEPTPFHRSVPRFMQDIAKKYTTSLDGIETDLTATPVDTEDDVDALVHLLNDPARKVPIIAVSKHQDGNGQQAPLLDADSLARAVFGTAHVRTLSCNGSLALTERIGRRLSVFRGAVRIWHPCSCIVEADPYDHPLFLAERIRDDRPEVVFRDVVDNALRFSAERRDASKLAPTFAEVRRVAIALERQREMQAADSAQRLLQLHEEENRDLKNSISEIEAEYAAYMELADSESKQVCSERDAARAEIANLRSRLAYFEHNRPIGERALPFPVPDDFAELEQWVTQHLSGTVHVLPRALRAARKSGYESPGLAYRALLLLRDAYVPMRRSESEDGRQLWTNGLAALGLILTPSFSGSRAGQFGDEYFVKWKGRRRALDLHLKGNSNREPRYGFRLYFFWCDKSRSPVVGWFPSHLTTDLT